MPVALDTAVPEFSAAATGGTLSLADFRGRILVLYFYPKDNTPGCTTESQEFRDAYDAFRAANADVVGVSRDSLKSHAGFKAKYALPFELISDPDEVLCTQFDVMKMKNMYGKKVWGIERSTFVIGPDGRLIREWRGLRVLGHVAEVLEFVQSLAP